MYISMMYGVTCYFSTGSDLVFSTFRVPQRSPMYEHSKLGSGKGLGHLRSVSAHVLLQCSGNNEGDLLRRAVGDEVLTTAITSILLRF